MGLAALGLADAVAAEHVGRARAVFTGARIFAALGLTEAVSAKLGGLAAGAVLGAGHGVFVAPGLAEAVAAEGVEGAGATVVGAGGDGLTAGELALAVAARAAAALSAASVADGDVLDLGAAAAHQGEEGDEAGEDPKPKRVRSHRYSRGADRTWGWGGGKAAAGLAEGVAQFLARCPRCLYRHGGMNPVRATMSYSDPGADPFAAVVGSHKGRAKPEWCVDFGVVLEAMTTFELWNAIERGDVTVRARVWREGLECWTPVDRLPELSLAVARSPSPSEVRLSGPRAEAPSLRAERISLPPESSPRSQDLPTLPAAPKALASDPRVEQAARVEQSAQSARRARVEPRDSVSPAARRWGSFRARGGHWIALGASVGALSTAIALARTSPAEPPGRAMDAQSAVMLEGVEHERGRGVDVEDEAQRSAEAWDTPAAAGAAARHRPTARARHDERGQRRLPRDGRSAR